MNWVRYVNCMAEGNFEWKPEIKQDHLENLQMEG
jgi:hypothetical protein